MGQTETKAIDLNNFETMNDFKKAIGELKNTHTMLLEAKEKISLEQDAKAKEFSKALLEYTEAKTIADCKCHGQRLWYTGTQRYQDECVAARIVETANLIALKGHSDQLKTLTEFKEVMLATVNLVEGTINTNSKYIQK